MVSRWWSCSVIKNTTECGPVTCSKQTHLLHAGHGFRGATLVDSFVLLQQLRLTQNSQPVYAEEERDDMEVYLSQDFILHYCREDELLLADYLRDR
jgi:hypothetical protein